MIKKWLIFFSILTFSTQAYCDSVEEDIPEGVLTVKNRSNDTLSINAGVQAEEVQTGKLFQGEITREIAPGETAVFTKKTLSEDLQKVISSQAKIENFSITINGKTFTHKSPNLGQHPVVITSELLRKIKLIE